MFNSLSDILYFDEPPAIFQIISIEILVTLFTEIPESNCLYDLIFDRIVKETTDYNIKMLNDLDEHLENIDKFDATKQEILRDISCFAIVNLSKQKSTKEFYDKLRPKLFNIISETIKSNEMEKCNLQKLLAAFATIVNTMLQRKDECNDENVSHTFKQFAKHIVDCHNVSSVKMLGIAISNRTALKYTEDELKELNQLYWNDFRQKCANENQQITRDQAKSIDVVLKDIFSIKTVDEWIKLLIEIEHEIKNDNNNVKLKEHRKLLSSMAKCQLNKEKGQIFSEFLKKTLFWIRMNARSKSNADISIIFDETIHLLECYTIFVNNIQISASSEIIDDILMLLLEIKVNKIQPNVIGVDRFIELLNKMIDLTQSLINHRHVFITDRVPPFSSIFKDLLQTICWYKSDRDKQNQLDQAEVTMLAEMAHQLEK